MQWISGWFKSNGNSSLEQTFNQTIDILNRDNQVNNKKLQDSFDLVLKDLADPNVKIIDPNNPRYKPKFKNSKDEIDNIWDRHIKKT